MKSFVFLTVKRLICPEVFYGKLDIEKRELDQSTSASSGRIRTFENSIASAHKMGKKNIYIANAVKRNVLKEAIR